MRVGAVLFIVLGAFVLVAGTVYGIWGTELAGTVYLCVLGVAFVYLARVLLHAARSEPAATEDPAATGAAAGGHGAEGESLSREALEPVPVAAHASPPAITPFLFALAGALVVLGLVFTRWLVLVGALGLGLVAIAWVIETAPRRHAEGHGEEHGGEHGATGAGDHTDAGTPAPSEH